MPSAQYAPLPTSEHPQAIQEPTRESAAWFWNGLDRSIQVQVVSVERDEAPQRTPPTPQDAVFSNITPARTNEAEELERALVQMGFISPGALQPPEAPPYYQPAPSYETVEDPITLASYLFKYGFVFPLFWLVGAFIIVSDLHHESSSSSSLESQPSTSQPPSPTTPKTSYEQQLKQEEMALLRLAELKWAWRCAYAFAIWLVLFVTAVAVVLGTGCIRLF